MSQPPFRKKSPKTTDESEEEKEVGPLSTNPYMTWTTGSYKMAGLKVAMMGADKNRCSSPDWISRQTGLQVQAGKR